MNNSFLVLASLIISLLYSNCFSDNSVVTDDNLLAVKPAFNFSNDKNQMFAGFFEQISSGESSSLAAGIFNNAQNIGNLLQGWVDDIASLSYRSSDKLTVRIPGSNGEVIEYDWGFIMSGDVFQPFTLVPGHRYKKTLSHVVQPVEGMLGQVIIQNALAKQVKAHDSFSWLTGGSLKPLYLFMIKYFLLVKDLASTSDIIFFREETVRLLFRLFLSGDVTIQSGLLSSLLPQEFIFVLRTINSEVVDTIDLFWNKITGTQGFVDQKNLSNNDTVAVFVFNNEQSATSFINLLMNFSGDDVYTELRKIIVAHGYEIVSYKDFSALLANKSDIAASIPSCLVPLHPRNKLVGCLDFKGIDNNTAFLSQLIPTASKDILSDRSLMEKRVILLQDKDGNFCIFCLKKNKEFSLGQALQQIVFSHIVTFKKYVECRQDCIKNNYQYRIDVEKEVRDDLLTRTATARYLKSTEGIASLKRLEAALLQVIQSGGKGIYSLDNENHVRFFASPNQLKKIEDDLSAFEFLLRKKQGEIINISSLLNEQKTELLSRRTGWRAYFEEHSLLQANIKGLEAELEEKQVEADFLTKQIKDKQRDLVVALQNQEEQQKKLNGMSVEKEKIFNSLWQIVQEKNSVNDKVYADAQQNLLALQKELEAEQRIDKSMYLSLEAIITCRNAIAYVYEEEASFIEKNNKNKFLNTSSYVSSYAHEQDNSLDMIVYVELLRKKAKKIISQNKQLQSLGNYCELVRMGKKTEQELTFEQKKQLAEDSEEVGYLLNAKDYLSVLTHVTDYFNRSQDFQRFLADLRNPYFSSVKQELVSNVRNIVDCCPQLKENGILIRYLVQVYMPHLIQAFEC